MTDDQQQTYDEFRKLVNMQPQELEDWLKTDASQSVGQSDSKGDDGDESIGHQSGRRIVEIKRTNKDDLSQDDLDHMKKVNGYIKRHTAQRPDGDVEDTNWCHSLKNWGHDPTK